MTLVQADLSQAELRVMALLSGDTWMINALQEGQGDFFDTHMMPVCFPNEDLAVLATLPVKKKELRTQVKTVQYGLAFGRQAYAIGVELGIDVRDAQKIIDNYLATAPQFAQWREDVMEAAVNPEQRDLLVNPFGRRFQSEVVTGKNLKNIQREALSFLPQSTASDICLSTAIRIHPWIKERGAHIVALIHDAIVVEAPNDYSADTIGKYIQKEFRLTGEMVFGTAVPFLSEYALGDNWGEL